MTRNAKGKKSLFRQSMEQKARVRQQAEAKKKATPSSLSESDVAKVKRSFLPGMNESDIQRDAEAIVGQMSEEERMAELDRVLKTVDPSLIAFLRKRSAYKGMSGASGGNPVGMGGEVHEKEEEVHEEEEVSEKEEEVSEKEEEVSEKEEEVSEKEEELARRIANEVDYSSLKTEADLENAVAKLPQTEQQKLEWTRPVTTASNPKEPRFHFNGMLLPASSSSTIAVHSGLYNHGEEADLPGYTVSELSLLARSAVSGQRVLALKCIYNILRRRSLSREFGQTLVPATLPVTVLRVLVFLLQRRQGMEEVYLALQCVEELCSTQEEYHRRLLLNLSYRGYEHAHLQDPSAMCFEADESEDDSEDPKDPFRSANCDNLFTMLSEAGILTQLFACVASFSAYPTVVASAFSVLRVLVESDKRFGEAIIDSHVFYSQIEKWAKQFVDPSTLCSCVEKEPPSGEHSLRLYILTHAPSSPVSVAVQLMLVIEALVRHSRKNASNMVRSAALPALKQWLSFYTGEVGKVNDANEVNNASEVNDANEVNKEGSTGKVNDTPSHSCVVDCILEGVLSCWRLCLLYGLDCESLDPFLPALVRISQFSRECNQILTWSLLEISVRTKSSTSCRYFVEYCNTLVMLVVEQLKRKETPRAVHTAVVHFLASYVEVVNDGFEAWEAEESVVESLRSQILQFGYELMQESSSLLTAVEKSHRAVYEAWSHLKERPNVVLLACCNA